MNEYLVVYDYGMGGAWGFACAQTQDDLARAFPELQVVSEWPHWLDSEREAEMRSNSSFVFGDPSTYPEWLRVLVSER